MRGKTILLIIGGGVAAYKSLDLIRRLGERSVRVRVILTKAGTEFVTPLSVAALTGTHVFQDLFSLTNEAEMGHIQLSRSADLVVVAPATADLMAKLAQGRADDLASTALLATDKAVLMAPAMNVRMWNHPATQRNLAMLKRDGVLFVGPGEGEMACGEFGTGRLAEPEEIAAAIENALAARADGPLNGVAALVTAGPTHEPLDPVRYLANRSSGKQGYAIAAALAAAGAKTTLVSGPVEIEPPARVKLVRVETAREMLAACEAALPADLAICCAAVADWRPMTEAAGKMKKIGDESAPSLALTPNPDILARIAKRRRRPALVVGFAAETSDVVAHAQAKRIRKGCDWMIANDVTTGVMGADTNRVHLVTADGVEDWPRLGKHEVARRLVGRIVGALSSLGAAGHTPSKRAGKKKRSERRRGW